MTVDVEVSKVTPDGGDRPRNNQPTEKSIAARVGGRIRGLLDRGRHLEAFAHLASGQTEDPTTRAEAATTQDKHDGRLISRLLGHESRRRDHAVQTQDSRPETSRHTTVSLIDTRYSDDKLVELRDPEFVGPMSNVPTGEERYGVGLVNEYHRNAKTRDAHEMAQEAAYRAFQGKIDRGVVDPSAMTQEMCKKLGVTNEIGRVPSNYDSIIAEVNADVRRFSEAQHLSEEETVSIEREVYTFTKIYGEAYGTENVAKAYVVARDNARKLTYQAAMDKYVLSGSDHGTRHIIDGNIKFAMQLVKSLREHGVAVSAKDQVILHQVMIDHDLGYTTGAAQAEGGYDASRDHPLGSARFVEDNKAYYLDKFGEEGYQAIFSSVLNHSYPLLEYQSQSSTDVNPKLIEGVASSVDSLGITVETKTPEIFWSADAMKILLKVQLAAQTTMEGPVDPSLMAQYKGELLDIANKEKNEQRREAYKNAITSFFNEYKASNTLGHYTGVVTSVSAEPATHGAQSEITQDHGHDHGDDDHSDLGDKRLRLVVQIMPTEIYALLGNMFGDRFANSSFAKAMGDLGLDTDQLTGYGQRLKAAKQNGEEMPDKLDVTHEAARVTVGTNFLEDLPANELIGIVGAEKIKDIAKAFQEVYELSIRAEINQLLDQINTASSNEIPQLVDSVRDLFVDSITGKVNELELRTLSSMLDKLKEPFGGIRDETITNLRYFRTDKESKFLGITSVTAYADESTQSLGDVYNKLLETSEGLDK
jgi:hypothetical protein